MSEPLIIYHAGCVDGFTAAWAVHKANGGELLPAVYNKPPPDVTGRDVFVVDFHYDRETTLRMKEQARWMQVLDHHRTAEEALAGIEGCYFDNSRSGAALAWDYCFTPESRPWMVDYAQDRDLWTWNLPDSRAVNAYLQAVDRTLDQWDRLYDAPVDTIIPRGEAILMAIEHYISDHKRNARLVEVGDHLVPVINAPHWHTSELLEHLCLTPLRPDAKPGSWFEQTTVPGQGEPPPFAVGWYKRNDEKIVHSLRSRPHAGREAFNVGKLAVDFGGGGHHQAAGFESDRVEFE